VSEHSSGSRIHEKIDERLVAKLNHTLPFRSERYTCTLYQTAQNAKNPPFKLQEWFGPGLCVVISPESYSGRVLNEDEARTLLSAGAIALSHLNLSDCPVFIPIHDALRDAWKGLSLTSPNFLLRRFESDSIHGGRVAVSELGFDPAAQFRLLASRLRSSANRARKEDYTNFLEEIASSLTSSLTSFDPPDSQNSQRFFQALERAVVAHRSDSSLSNTSRHYYVVTEGPEANCVEGGENGEETYYDARETTAGSGDGEDQELLFMSSWDATAAWAPWASYPDPIGSLEVEIVRTMTFSPSYQGNSQLTEWNLSVMRTGYIPDDGHRPLILMQSVDQSRQFLELEIDSKPEENSFSGMLLLMCNHAQMVQAASSIGQLVTQEWWLSQGTFYVPETVPSKVLADAVQDIFGATDGDFSLTARLALHALRLGDPAAVASLWLRCLRQLRFGLWDTRIPFTERLVDLKEEEEPSAPVKLELHQKLLTVALCIDALNAEPARRADIIIDKPELEGERALYMLESLSPAALYTQLLVVAFNEAMALCVKVSDAYRLATLNDAIVQLKSESRSTALSSSSNLFLHHQHVSNGDVHEEEDDKSITMGTMWPETVQLYRSSSDIDLFIKQLRSQIQEFRRIEMSVVAAHSLWIRLAMFINKKEKIDQSMSSRQSNIVDRLIGATLRPDLPAMTALTQEESDCLLRLGIQKEEAFRTEWIIELGEEHRLFIRMLPGEMRVATVVSDVG
jgi:hypothetical protein